VVVLVVFFDGETSWWATGWGVHGGPFEDSAIKKHTGLVK